MLRRDFLKLGLGATSSLWLPPWLQAEEDTLTPIQGGWINNPDIHHKWIKTQIKPYLTQQNKQIRGTGRGKKVFLWKYFEEITGSALVPHRQTIGDCVGHAFGLGVDVLTAVQMLMLKKPERWIAKAATEIIYAGSRCEVGRNRFKYVDGSTGPWAGEFISKWGILQRKKYLGGRYDYTEYSGQVARDLGKEGVPDALEALCKLHPVKTVSICRSWSECRDAIANGHLVCMCSSVGFKTKGGRDRDGFLMPGRRPWMHAMLIAGIDDHYKRPGGLIINSWGSRWTYGPKRHGQPEGSFWADASVIDRGLRQGGSMALSAYVGYPRFDLDYRFW